MQYDSNDIIGLSLYAKKVVPIKALPLDNAPIVRYVQPGQLVGKVYSYLVPKPGRFDIYWMFDDGQGNVFYAPHRSGLYNLQNLRDQGLLTKEEKEAQEKPIALQFGEKVLKTGVTTYLGIQALKILLRRG